MAGRGQNALTAPCHVRNTLMILRPSAPMAARPGRGTPTRKNAVQNVKMFALAVVGLGLFAGSAFRAGDSDTEKPKYTIKQVMAQAHRKADRNSPSLSDKVIGGKADKDEQAKLLELYTALAANKPPKGEAEAWKDRATA